MKGSAQRKQQQIKARKSFLHSLSAYTETQSVAPTPTPARSPSPRAYSSLAELVSWASLLCVSSSDDEDVVASLMGADFCRNLRLKCFALAIVLLLPAPCSLLPFPACASCGPFCCSSSSSSSGAASLRFFFLSFSLACTNFILIFFELFLLWRNHSSAQPLSHSTRFA